MKNGTNAIPQPNRIWNIYGRPVALHDITPGDQWFEVLEANGVTTALVVALTNDRDAEQVLSSFRYHGELITLDRIRDAVTICAHSGHGVKPRGEIFTFGELPYVLTPLNWASETEGR